MSSRRKERSETSEASRALLELKCMILCQSVLVVGEGYHIFRYDKNTAVKIYVVQVMPLAKR